MLVNQCECSILFIKKIEELYHSTKMAFCFVEIGCHRKIWWFRKCLLLVTRQIRNQKFHFDLVNHPMSRGRLITNRGVLCWSWCIPVILVIMVFCLLHLGHLLWNEFTNLELNHMHPHNILEKFQLFLPLSQWRKWTLVNKRWWIILFDQEVRVSWLASPVTESFFLLVLS